ncbi:MAG: neuraminidase-like domain-containing protein, partial [bacterium]
MERREALVTYLLPRLRELGVENRSQLFEYFLIDVEMNPCMLTSRIKQAISAIQTFYQRCLMNLESQVHPRLINEGDWKWLKNYRVWEANRKVFLYPENWIEPELRDDKSPDFKALERTILQQEINKENVESAFIDYLQRLDEVSRLDVRAVWFERRERKSRGVRRQNRRILPPGAEWEEGTYHIFARTYNAPHKWFYRRLERGRTWTPWEKMDVDIEGDHLVPVMFQNRMHLFWTIFREKSKPTPDLKKDAAPFKLGKDWEIGLAYSVYDRGRWTRKQLSSANVVDNVNVQSVTLSKKGPVFSIEGSAWLPASAYTLRADAQNGSFSLTIYLYRRAVDSLRAARTVLRAFEDALLSKTDVELVARFELVGCNGELGPVTLGSSARIVHLGPQVSPRKRRRAQPSRLPPPTQLPPFQVSSGGRLPVPPGYIVDGNGFSAAESPGALLSMRTSTGGMGVVLGRSRGSPRGIRILPIVDTSRRPIAGLFPFFFQDPLRTYFVRPVAIWIGPSELRRPPTTVPLVGPAARVIVPHFGRRPGARLARRTSGARGRRRESLELAQSELALEADLGLERSEGGASEADLHLEAIDDWEDAEDEAWHPDDASERRSQRQRTPPARKPQPS